MVVVICPWWCIIISGGGGYNWKMMAFNLHSHLSRQRVNIKMVECCICGEDFSRKDALSRHLKRKYPCDGSRSRQSDKKSKSDESLLAQDMDHEDDSKIARPIAPTSGTDLTDKERTLISRYNRLLNGMIQKGEDNSEEMCGILNRLENSGWEVDPGEFDKIEYTSEKYCLDRHSTKGGSRKDVASKRSRSKGYRYHSLLY